MYSIRNLLEKNPIQISGVVIAILNFGIIQDWIDMSADGVAALNTALILLLGLFVTAKTENTAALEELSGDEGEITLGTVLVILQVIFFFVATLWFLDNAQWLWFGD